MDPIFGVAIPKSIKGVPDNILFPRNTWENKQAYDEKAQKLADMFAQNFQKFEEKASERLLKAGPKS